MNLFYFIRLLCSESSISEAMQDLFQAASVISVVLILLVGLIFFLPTILSGLRQAKARWLIFIVNVIFIVVAFFNISLAIVIWILLMILAVTGKKEVQQIKTGGVKITYSNREDD